jgi:hypothetical protein
MNCLNAKSSVADWSAASLISGVGVVFNEFAGFESLVLVADVARRILESPLLSQNGGGRFTASFAFMEAQGNSSDAAPIFGGVLAGAGCSGGLSVRFSGIVIGEYNSGAATGSVLSASAGIGSSVACQISP